MNGPGMSRGTTTRLEGLLEDVRRGDGAAMDEVLRVAWPRVQALAQAIVHRQSQLAGLEATDDVCGQAYLNFARKLREGLERPFESVGQLLAYIGTTVRHAATDEVERRFGPKFQAQFPRTPISNDPATRDQLDEVNTRLIYQQMIDTLEGEERTVVELHFTLGHSQDEVADALGQTRRWVAARLAVALRRLKERFRDPRI